MKKQESKKFNKTLVFTIVIMALFISVISIGIITISLNNKNNAKLLDNFIPNIKAYKYYSIDDSKFKSVAVENDVLIGDMCIDGCNLSVNYNGEKYYYMIIYNNETYRLNLIKDNHVIISKENLGSSISDAYFKIYKDYVVFYNKIAYENYEYDYALVSDNKFNVDEFTSLNSGELEFTSNGIIYYYDVCASDKNQESQKIKAIRKPFNTSPKVLDRESINFSWC